MEKGPYNQLKLSLRRKLDFGSVANASFGRETIRWSKHHNYGTVLSFCLKWKLSQRQVWKLPSCEAKEEGSHLQCRTGARCNLWSEAFSCTRRFGCTSLWATSGDETVRNRWRFFSGVRWLSPNACVGETDRNLSSALPVSVFVLSRRCTVSALSFVPKALCPQPLGNGEDFPLRSLRVCVFACTCMRVANILALNPSIVSGKDSNPLS